MAPRRKKNVPSVEQLHHRTAFSIAIIVANMVISEHRQYCMEILGIHNPTQIYVKILIKIKNNLSKGTLRGFTRTLAKGGVALA